MGCLRDLRRGVQCPAIKGVDEGSEIPMSAQAAEAAARFLECGGDPADEHVAIAPATDVAGKATDEAIERRLASVASASPYASSRTRRTRGRMDSGRCSRTLRPLWTWQRATTAVVPHVDGSPFLS